MQICCKAAIEMNGCGWWWSNTHHIGIQSGIKWVRCVRGACVGSLVWHDLWDVRSRFWCVFHRWLHMVTVRVRWRSAFVFNLKIHTRHPNTTRACTQFARTLEQMNTYMYCIALFAVYNIVLCVLLLLCGGMCTWSLSSLARRRRVRSLQANAHACTQLTTKFGWISYLGLTLIINQGLKSYHIRYTYIYFYI